MTATPSRRAAARRDQHGLPSNRTHRVGMVAPYSAFIRVDYPPRSARAGRDSPRDRQRQVVPERARGEFFECRALSSGAGPSEVLYTGRPKTHDRALTRVPRRLPRSIGVLARASRRCWQKDTSRRKVDVQGKWRSLPGNGGNGLGMARGSQRRARIVVPPKRGKSSAAVRDLQRSIRCDRDDGRRLQRGRWDTLIARRSTLRQPRHHGEQRRTNVRKRRTSSAG